MKHEFKPFDRVLVRDDAAGDGWRASFFSHYSVMSGKPVTINGWEFSRMIPYEGNEALLGTTDWPEPELKKGDIVAVWDKNQMFKKIRVYSHYDAMQGKHAVYAFTDSLGFWDHAEKFVPASVES